MNEAVLLDLYGECRTLNATNTHVGSLTEALQQCAGKPAHLLTDWGSGALFGIATVTGTPSTAAALLEKQLRDQGETDDISHILVHQSQARMGSTEIALHPFLDQIFLQLSLGLYCLLELSLIEEARNQNSL